MPYLSANGIDLHYQTAGEGKPLLLIAGFGSDSASWAPVAPALSRSRRLIMPDNRYCGRTRATGATDSLRNCADDCVALLDRLGLRHVDVIGHSMGGLIAMDLAADRPDRVGKVIIAASHPRPGAHARAVIENLVALREAGAPDEHWQRSFFTWVFSRHFFNDTRAVEAAIALAIGYPHKQSVDDMRRQCDLLQGADLSTSLEKISAKMLAIAGEDDLLFPLADMRQCYAALPNSAFEVLPDAAHSVHWDQPEAFVSAVSRFLDRD